MDASKRAVFFRKLEERIQECHIETNLLPPQNHMGETLRAMLPVTDEGDASLMEIMTAPFVKEADLLVFYTTMVAKINGDGEELLHILPQWNLECPLGGYGIFNNEEIGLKQFFHNYAILFDPDTNPEELAEKAMFHLMIIYEIISRKYKDAYALAKA